jgi:hypothetical protein
MAAFRRIAVSEALSQKRHSGTKLMGVIASVRSPTVTPEGLSDKRDEQQCFGDPKKCIVSF